MNPLEIVVTGNIDGAKSSLQTVQNELGKTALAAQKSDSAIDTFGKTMARFGTQGGASIALLTGKIEALKAEMVNIKDISVLAKFNKEIEASEAQLSSLTNAGKKGFNDLGVAVEGMGNPLSKGYGLLRKLAYVLPGIGISGIVAFATEPIINFVQELIKANSSMDSLKQRISDVEADIHESAKAYEQATANVNKLTIDIDLAKKGFLNKDEVLKEYNSTIGKTTGQVNSLDEAEQALVKNGKAYVDMLLYQAAANVALQNAAKKAFEAEETRRKNASEFEKVIDRSNNFNITSQKDADRATAQIKKNEEDRKAAKIKAATDAKNEQLSIAADFEKQAAEIAAKFKFKFNPDPGTGKKGPDPFEIYLKDLEDNYKKAQALLVSQYDANLTDAKKNTTAVNDLVLKAQQDFLEKKLALIKRYGKKEGDTDLEIAKVNKALIANQIGFNIEQINTLPKVQGAPSINFKKATTEKIDPKPYYVLSDAIQKNIKDQERMKELLEQTTVVLNKTLGPAFDTLFTNILEGSGNAFKAFGDAIKQMLVQLGAAILKAALFSAILSVISGGASNVAGGKSFMDLFAPSMKSITGFASGGSISGPGTSTSDSILARVSNGEYIMNANAVSKFGASFFDGLNSGRLPKFASGGPVGSNTIVASSNNVFIPEVTLKGQDLIVVFNRANQRASRNG
jgi:hypothetical protein